VAPSVGSAFVINGVAVAGLEILILCIGLAPLDAVYKYPLLSLTIDDLFDTTVVQFNDTSVGFVMLTRPIPVDVLKYKYGFTTHDPPEVVTAPIDTLETVLLVMLYVYKLGDAIMKICPL
jgi:hypothetical protein